MPPAARTELVGPTGNVIRALSAPPSGRTDSSPALAASAQQVFFVRSDVAPAGPKATTIANSAILRVPLTGGSARLVPVHASIKSGALSANADGTELAATCLRHRYHQACVFDLPSGRLRYVSSAPTGVVDVALSPNSQYIAYGTAEVLYAYDFQTRQTITVSSLPGYNEQPNWLQDGGHPCLLFANLQTAGNTIYLACLTPQLGWAKVAQGEYPEWLGP